VIPDVNVLLAAFRSDHFHHRIARTWLDASLDACETGASVELLPMVTVGFLRLVTNAKIFAQPTPVSKAVDFVEALLSVPGVAVLEVGREWGAMVQACREYRLSGNAIPDAWIAAAVRTSGGHLVTLDRDFTRLLDRAELTILTKKSERKG
jgi:toxin-antitoxin system PIN domain toxin